ncbi:hemolysin family protein [Thalassobacillus pellis]|uniref:hemolysin family protein n=1 Tax=Thalassobacillus pellis TaxID=748008 RepID=UPI00195F9DA3|nr:hemolysin family protein [Thalassobacillus pellis]MBM7553546.1 CBS domain containing-hemolysin-like protein [Thalassobacillus pellis]
MDTSIKLAAVVLLIVLTAFFVASEFAIVKVRKTKMEARAKEGDKKAANALKLTNNLDYYLSACQLGITITALGLGWLGEPTLEDLLHPLLTQFNLPSGVSHTISFAIAFFIITFLHVVLGELAPKTLAIQKAENITLLLAKPLILYSKLMYPLIWLLNGSANMLIRMLGYQTASESDEVHSEEELRHILSESYEKGEINQSEYEYVDRIFEFDNRTAKEIMVPRTEISVIDIEDPVEESLNFLKKERFTRYPVIQDDKDHIIGVIHIKEIFQEDWDQLESLRHLVHPVIKVFENIPIHDLLIRMQKENTHLVVLTDEYGGTAGIVTVEDIIEEIVGDIRDEFDEEEEQDITPKEDGTFVLDGKTSISDINNYFEIDLENGDIDTISGWILNHNVDAHEGSVVSDDSFHFKVLKIEDNQIRKVIAWADA